MGDTSPFEKTMVFGIILMGIFYLVLPLLSFLFGTTKEVGFAVTNPNPENNPHLFSFAFGSIMIIAGLALLLRRERKSQEWN